MPSFISLTSEYSPRRLRAVIVALLWAGFPLGGFVGGLLASWIIPAFGWQSVFWVGGVLPLLVGVALVFALPESIGFLVARGAPADQITSLLQKAFPGTPVPADATFVLNEEPGRGVPVAQLFAMGRAAGTILLWISFFIAFMMLVTNSAWAPTLLKREGVGIREAALAMALYNLGSVVATTFVGWLIVRAGASLILPIAMVCSALSIALTGYAAPDAGKVILLEGLFGLFLGGGSSGLIALAAIYYPTAIRSTGVGWAMGMGRVGSFTGPLVVGSLVALGLSTADIFVAIGVPALLAAVTTAIVGPRQGGVSRAQPEGQAPLGSHDPGHARRPDWRRRRHPRCRRRARGAACRPRRRRLPALVPRRCRARRRSAHPSRPAVATVGIGGPDRLDRRCRSILRRCGVARVRRSSLVSFCRAGGRYHLDRRVAGARRRRRCRLAAAGLRLDGITPRCADAAE